MAQTDRSQLLSKISPKAMQGILMLTSILLVLVVMTFAWLYQETARARSESIPRQIHQQTQQLQQRMATFFAPIADELMALRFMALNRAISLDDSDAAMTALAVEATTQKQSLGIDGFVLADTQGRENKWIKTGDQWHSVKSAYDVRNKPWFQRALQLTDPNAILWSEIYTFHSRQKPGVTVAQSYRLADTQYVIAFDIALGDFVDFVTDMDIAPQGQLLLYRDKKIADLKQYAALPTDALPGQEEDFWKDLSDMKGSVSVSAVSAWVKEGAPLGRALTFSHDKETYWAEFDQQMPGRSKSQIAVLVPESAMIQTARRAAIWLFAAAGIALMGVVVLLAILLRKQSRLLNEAWSYVGHVSENEPQLLATIATGENNQLEFKSTLRWHLKANKAAKEIEIACMKTLAAFLNSEGGTLLVGVEDNGNILGIEQDGFPNDDKFLLHFNNLLKQHLGLECAPFVAFEIKHIEGKSVLVVDCRRSASPVFVTHGDKEDFYIRVGPGSRQLSTSEVLAYIHDHFG